MRFSVSSQVSQSKVSNNNGQQLFQDFLKQIEKGDQAKVVKLMSILQSQNLTWETGNDASLDSKIINFIKKGLDKKWLRIADLALVRQIAEKHIVIQGVRSELDVMMLSFVQRTKEEIQVQPKHDSPPPPATEAPREIAVVAAAPVPVPAAAIAEANAGPVAPVLEVDAREQIEAKIRSLPEEKRTLLNNFKRECLGVVADESRVLSILDKIITIPEPCFREALSLFSTINTLPRLKVLLIENVLGALGKYDISEFYSLKLMILNSLFARGLSHRIAIESMCTWETLTELQQNKASESMQLLFEQDQLWSVLFAMAYPEPNLEAWEKYVFDLSAILFATHPNRFPFWVEMFRNTSKEARALIIDDIGKIPENANKIRLIDRTIVAFDLSAADGANARLNRLHVLLSAIGQ